jgi:CRP/FNR family transcriptional regulator, cyclic AMP receptor protein
LYEVNCIRNALVARGIDRGNLRASLIPRGRNEKGNGMKNRRRSGSDRRKSLVYIPENHRNGGERREVLKDPDVTTGRLRTVPMFDGLSPGQIAGLLAICSKRTCARNERLLSLGDESVEMFVLVQGKLGIAFPGGEEISAFSPAGVVGGVGLFTGERCLVTVTAATDCIVLAFGRDELFALFDADQSLRTTVLINVIRDMVRKFRKDNDALDSLRRARTMEIL